MAKFNEFLPVDISVKDILNNTGKQIDIWGLTPNEMTDILGRLTIGGGRFAKPNPDKHVRNVWAKGKVFTITINNDDLDAFLDSGLKSVQSALIHSRPKEADGILALTDEVASKCETISKDEMNKLFNDSEASEVEMWQNYLNNIEDPKTREMLILYSKIYGNTVYGHQLSLKNAMTIRRIDPNATFVLGKSSWVKFGRGVKRGAKRYPLWGWLPDNEKISKTDIDKAQNELGHGGQKFEDLSVTVKDAIMKKATEMTGTKGRMYRYIGYDISDTYKYSKEDLLQSKPGIIGNVAYTLNKLAQDLENEKNNGKEIEGHDEMMVKTEKAVKEVEKMCVENNINVDTTSQNASIRLVDLLLSYYQPLVSAKSNILKVTNQKPFTEDAVQLTLLMNNIALDQLKRFRHSYEYTQKEASALAPIIRTATYRIGRAINNNISEGTENKGDFLQRFKQALKTLGIKIVKDEPAVDGGQVLDTTNNVDDTNNIKTPEMIRENFYRIYNKLIS